MKEGGGDGWRGWGGSCEVSLHSRVRVFACVCVDALARKRRMSRFNASAKVRT